MCEQSSWSKSCVADLPVGDRATAFKGDASCFLSKGGSGQGRQKSPTNNALPCGNAGFM